MIRFKLFNCANLITIRRALTNDIPGIRLVLAITWHDSYSSFLSQSSIAKVTAEWHSPKVLEAELNRPSTFFGVAESNSDGIVGVVTAHAQDEVLSIARLYVLPEFQRQGIGEKLLRESSREFPQTRRVKLDVEEKNTTGRAFYRKHGFHEIGTKNDDIAGTKLNSIVLEKLL